MFGLFAKNKFGREKILNCDGGSISQDGRRTRKVNFLNLPEQSGRTEVTRRHLTKIMSSVCGRMEASQLSLSSNKQPNEGFVSNKVGCISILNSSIVNDSLSYSVLHQWKCSGQERDAVEPALIILLFPNFTS